MNKRIKKLIAREGFVLCCFVASLVITLIVANTIFTSKYWAESIGGFGFGLLVLGYPIYLLIRFILWAIKILREK